jgi:hypothetical protein
VPHRRIASDPERGSVYEHPGIAELPATRPWYPRMSSCPPTATATPMHMPAASTPGSVSGPVDWPVFPLLQEKLQSSIPGGGGSTQRYAATPSPPPAVRESRAGLAGRPEHGAREAPAKPDAEQQRRDERPRQRTKEPRKEKDVRAAAVPPAQMSRTQREKDRKKRSKARVLVEHVDLIKDDFWEARPWILSGTTG